MDHKPIDSEFALTAKQMQERRVKRIQDFFIEHSGLWFRGITVSMQTDVSPMLTHEFIRHMSPPLGDFLLVEHVNEPESAANVYYTHQPHQGEPLPDILPPDTTIET